MAPQQPRSECTCILTCYVTVAKANWSVLTSVCYLCPTCTGGVLFLDHTSFAIFGVDKYISWCRQVPWEAWSSNREHVAKNGDGWAILLVRTGSGISWHCAKWAANPYILIWLGPGRREPVAVRVRSLAQKSFPYKVNGVFEVIVFSLWKSVLLDVDVSCIRWLLFCFASIFRNKKKKRKSLKYRPLWQLNFFPRPHEPVDRHWPPGKSSSFTKTARKKVPIFLRTMRWNPVPFDRLRWKTCLAFD